MRIEIKFNRKRIKVADLLAIEEAQEGKRPNRVLIGVLSKLVTNGSGEYLPLPKAAEMLSDLDLEEFEQLISSFLAAVKEIQQQALPPLSGGS